MTSVRNPDLPPLAKNIKRLRQQLGWTQDQLASEAGVSSVAMYEAGLRPNPRGANVVAIARALGVSVEDLYAEQP